MSKTRAIRFAKEEDRKIEEFLKNNPVFDFSTLARLAILAFVKDPKLTLRPVREAGISSSEKRTHGHT